MKRSSSKPEFLSTAVLVASSLMSVALGACGSATDGADSRRQDAGEVDGGRHDAGRDTGPSDAGSSDAGRTDAGSTDAGPTDAGRTDAGSTDAGSIDAHGFAIRKPALRTVPCDLPYCPDPATALDEDYLCTFKYGTVDGFLYVQATPKRFIYSNACEFETVGGWVSVDGGVTAVESSYDFGGNHHNDGIIFSYLGQRYRFYHSSFGFGWHACQPMDCIQLMTGDAVSKDGCDAKRSLPIVCVSVTADGGVPPLVDSYAKCAGDPNRGDGG